MYLILNTLGPQIEKAIPSILYFIIVLMHTGSFSPHLFKSPVSSSLLACCSKEMLYCLNSNVDFINETGWASSVTCHWLRPSYMLWYVSGTELQLYFIFIRYPCIIEIHIKLYVKVFSLRCKEIIKKWTLTVCRLSACLLCFGWLSRTLSCGLHQGVCSCLRHEAFPRPSADSCFLRIRSPRINTRINTLNVKTSRILISS